MIDIATDQWWYLEEVADASASSVLQWSSDGMLYPAPLQGAKAVDQFLQVL